MAERVGTVSSEDLGAAVCRAIMREMDGRPLTLETLAGIGERSYEYTTASAGAIMQQWCAVVLPLPDMISVRAHLNYWGMGIWCMAHIGTDPAFPHNLFVRYPEDPAAIIGAAFEGSVRAAVEIALAAAESDRAAVETSAPREGTP